VHHRSRARGRRDDFRLEIIGLQTSIEANTECIGECRIGAVAPMSDTHCMSGASGMDPSSRDRLSVDLHGLKAALLDRANALGVTPSGFVRTTLAEALGQPVSEAVPPQRCPNASSGDRVRLCMRMTSEHARATVEAARRARMTPGDLVGGLVLGVPVLSAGGSRADHIATLVASSAELSTLSRNIHRLSLLLRQANVEPARQYREMLDTLAADVRHHLELAAVVLADLQPQRRSTAMPPRSGH
jgi:hypothetical protein